MDCPRCRCLVCLGLAATIAFHHDPPHALDPVPGAQALTLGKFAIVAASTTTLRFEGKAEITVPTPTVRGVGHVTNAT